MVGEQCSELIRVGRHAYGNGGSACRSELRSTVPLPATLTAPSRSRYAESGSTSSARRWTPSGRTLHAFVCVYCVTPVRRVDRDPAISIAITVRWQAGFAARPTCEPTSTVLGWGSGSGCECHSPTKSSVLPLAATHASSQRWQCSASRLNRCAACCALGPGPLTPTTTSAPSEASSNPTNTPPVSTPGYVPMVAAILRSAAATMQIRAACDGRSAPGTATGRRRRGLTRLPDCGRRLCW